MPTFLWFYIIFSYLYCFGPLINRKELDFMDILMWIFAPIVMPIHIGLAVDDIK